MLQILPPDSIELETISSGVERAPVAVWYDLFSPEYEEITAVESTLKIRLPSQAEMREIEPSSRLFLSNGTLHMTSVIIASAETESPIPSPVTFILTKDYLVTIRHSNPRPFTIFPKKITTHRYRNAESLFLGLIDSIVERIADILEEIAAEIELISSEIFKAEHHVQQREMREILVHLGKKGDLNTKIRESLESIDRQLAFYQKQIFETAEKKTLSQISILRRDVKSLVELVSFTFTKINFLLDAALGLINIEQNAIIKIFSVAAVIFLPPTLIASIYGMNFHNMPELHWVFGYPLALLLMAISVFGSLIYFKRKGWL